MGDMGSKQLRRWWSINLPPNKIRLCYKSSMCYSTISAGPLWATRLWRILSTACKPCSLDDLQVLQSCKPCKQELQPYSLVAYSLIALEALNLAASRLFDACCSPPGPGFPPSPVRGAGFGIPQVSSPARSLHMPPRSLQMPPSCLQMVSETSWMSPNASRMPFRHSEASNFIKFPS